MLFQYQYRCRTVNKRLYLRQMGEINSIAKSAFAGGSHHSLSQIFLHQFSKINLCLNHRVAFRYRWFTSWASKHPEIWRGKIKTKFYLSEFSCVWGVACGQCWPQMSGRSSFPRDCPDSCGEGESQDSQRCDSSIYLFFFWRLPSQ